MNDLLLPKDIQESPDKNADLYIMLGELGSLSYREKSYIKSLSYFEESLKHFNLFYNHVAANQNLSEDIIKYLLKQSEFIKGKIVELLNILGDQELKHKRIEEALSYYKKMLLYISNNASLLFKIASCLQEKGYYVSAVTFLEQVIKLRPQHADSYRLLGDIHREKFKNEDKATEYYKKYIESNNAQKNVSSTLDTMEGLRKDADKYKTIEEKIKYLETTIESLEKGSTEYMDSIRSLAIAYYKKNMYPEAIECVKKLFKYGVTQDDYFFYGCLNLRIGNFSEGWKYYEYRPFDSNNKMLYPDMTKPKWEGQDISDKTLLVQCEHDFGEMIQSFRYVKLLKEQQIAKNIIFRVPDSLVELLGTSSDDIKIRGLSTSVKTYSFDYYCHLMSLMSFFKTTKDNIPMADGYIKADENKVSEFKKEYFDNNLLKVGIAWFSENIHNNTSNIPFSTFLPLTLIGNLKVYSLQNPTAAEKPLLRKSRNEIVNLSEKLKNFSDVAAALANLDVLITSDSSLLNLAGAMGIKTCALLDQNANWKWFMDKELTPWYKSVRIFRKKSDTDTWPLLMNNVIKYIKTIK